MFIDKATIKIQAGNGGNGKTSFNNPRFKARGKADGGDGGRGGDVILQADHNTHTLSKYRSAKLWQATEGGQGGSNRRHGKNGEDIILHVAPGTIAYDGETVIADLENSGQQAIVAKGGQGGFGNAHFKSSVRRSPKFAELGENGEAKILSLELKSVADVGLVGLPNAGKSTLLSVVSNARPEIANYPFTTLKPNLGVVDIDDASYIMADIPGLIEGASEGKGLGDDFLRHIERTKVLSHLIDVNSEDINKDFTTIRQELMNYSKSLANRPFLIVLTKAETKSKTEIEKLVKQISATAKLDKKDIMTISAVTSDGIVRLLRAINLLLQKQHKKRKPTKAEEIPTISLDTSKLWEVEKHADCFVVRGNEIEGFARRTNFDQIQAIARLRDIFRKKGIWREINKQGGEEGSVIEISGKRFTW